MKAHEIDYEIHGEEMQFVEIELDPHEGVVAESGSFMMMMIDGFISQMGCKTKALLCMRGWGIVSLGVRTIRSSYNKMSRSSTRGPNRTVSAFRPIRC